MNEGDRREWLEAAFIAVGDLPIALLERGAKAALQTADHPSKIVPAIMREIEADLKRRKTIYISEPRISRERHIAPQYCTPEEAANILAEYGLTSAFATKRDAA